MPPILALRGVDFPLQTAATTGNGNSCVAPTAALNHNWMIKGTGTISGGTISIEEADTVDYAGTWSVIQAVNGTDVTGGASKIVHQYGRLKALRARISSNITGGGTVDVIYAAN